MGTERSLKEKSFECSLRQELKLHINERLYRQGIISRNIYEQAKIRLVSKDTNS